MVEGIPRQAIFIIIKNESRKSPPSILFPGNGVGRDFGTSIDFKYRTV